MTGVRPVLVFARAPRLGEVKRRLAAGIGDAAALAFYRQTLDALVDRLVAAPDLHLHLVITPDDAVRDDRLWRPGVARSPQGWGDLGERMARALNAVPCHPALLVGSDVPGIEASHLRRAFDLLGDHDLVFGPSPDGGFWLVGVARPLPAQVFRGVRWSSRHALADSLGTIPAGWTHALADELADVDDADGLRRWMEPLPA